MIAIALLVFVLCDCSKGSSIFGSCDGAGCAMQWSGNGGTTSDANQDDVSILQLSISQKSIQNETPAGKNEVPIAHNIIQNQSWKGKNEVPIAHKIIHNESQRGKSQVSSQEILLPPKFKIPFKPWEVNRERNMQFLLISWCVAVLCVIAFGGIAVVKFDPSPPLGASKSTLDRLDSTNIAHN